MKCIILLSVILLMFSCGSVVDCELLADARRDDECLLIVEKLTDKYSRFDYKGTNPITEKKCDCNSQISDRWWSIYKGYIEVGDTLVKKKGELIFSIHKKDTVLSFNFECGDQVYK
ncbi:hypothetical protein QWY99_07215 [Flavobacterium branchiarum]|uniref:Lipoprotein n=1 Tax=Flavobacterium branchiarum TaxID=1114870 RepID=A0ABV5FRG5_9FLAO|nr:hypothetical protein [Flavobacterium branchiarum]MDN3672838.1 hypothetical protein [Flavobacterium branchiarum]